MAAMKKYVSYNGFLAKLKDTVKSINHLPAGASYVSTGRYVNKNDNYADAEYVSLYHVPGVGYYAVV